MSHTVLVVGTGSIGMRHLSVLAKLDACSPVAVPVRAERLQALRLEGHDAASLEQALARRPLAAVVATDTGRHITDTELLVGHGCHVLVEKPISPTATGLEALARAAQHHDRKVFVGCCLRFHPGLQCFRAELGPIGRLYHVRIECQSYLPEWRPGVDHRRTYAARADEGGVLRDLVHEIDYACWLFGRPQEVHASLTPGDVLQISSESGADLLWHVDGGPSVSVRLDYLTRTSRRRMTAFGENGEITWDAIANTLDMRLVGEQPRTLTVPFDRDMMMRAQARAFLDAITTESGANGNLLASFDDGAFVIALCDAARAAAVSGRRERVRDWRSV